VLGAGGSVLETGIRTSEEVLADNADLRRFFVMCRLSPFRVWGVEGAGFWVLGVGGWGWVLLARCWRLLLGPVKMFAQITQIYADFL